MKVTEKERQPEAAEMVRNFRHMIEGENWAKILPEMPEQLLKRNFENLCHAALLSRNSEQAVAFLLALYEKTKAYKLPPEQLALLTKTADRARTVTESGGWTAAENSQTQPEQVAQPFPRGVFPPMLERYLDSAAEHVQVDRAMVGAAMLAACALCLQGRCKIAYPSGSGHDEQLCLYLVIVGSPGERKSSAFSKAVLPVRKWQETRREEYKQELAEYETACKIKAKHAEAIERQLGEKNLTDEKRQRLGEDLTALALEQEDSTPPISPEILATDTTVEALSNLMEVTGETAGIFSDEADFLKILAGLYNSGKAGNLQLPLQAYDGSSFFRQRGSGTVFLKRPLLSVCLYAQPALYEEIRSNSDLQGRGMIGRLLFCVPEEMAGHRDVRKCVKIDKAAEAAYCDLLGDFLDTPQQPEETHAEDTVDTRGGGAYAGLFAAAGKLYAKRNAHGIRQGLRQQSRRRGEPDRRHLAYALDEGRCKTCHAGHRRKSHTAARLFLRPKAGGNGTGGNTGGTAGAACHGKVVGIDNCPRVGVYHSKPAPAKNEKECRLTICKSTGTVFDTVAREQLH